MSPLSTSHGACSGTGSRPTIAKTIRNAATRRSCHPSWQQAAALGDLSGYVRRASWRPSSIGGLPANRRRPAARSGAIKEVGFGCRLDEHVFFASRDGTRNPPLHPLRATGGTTKIERRKPASAGSRPPSGRREAGQPLRAALMLALTAPMSARPAAFAFTAPMTLPMSFMDVAPVVAMASLMRASTSAADSCVGR